MKRNRHNSGFSIVELMVGLVCTGLLGVLAYRSFTSNVGTQYDMISLQKLDQEALSAIEQLRDDLMSVDYNWRAYGVRPIAYEKGAGPDGSDWLTVMIPDHEIHTLRHFQTDVTSADLLDPSINHPVQQTGMVAQPYPSQGDRVLIYAPGQFLLRTVKETTLDTVEGVLQDIAFDEMSDVDIATSTHPGLEAQYPEVLEDFPFGQTVFQKIHVARYELANKEMNGESVRFLKRTYDGVEQWLAPIDHIAYRFNDMTEEIEPEGLQVCWSDIDSGVVTCPPVLTQVNWANVIAVTIDFRAKTRERDEEDEKQKNYGIRVSFVGDPVSENTKDAETNVVATGEFSNLTTGKPELDYCSEDGSYQLLVPAIDFDSSAGASVGKIALIDPDTGASNGDPIVLQTTGGLPVLPLGVVRDPGVPSRGVYVHGYSEDKSGNPQPTVVFIDRDNTTKKILPTSSVTVQQFAAVSELRDTISFAAVKDPDPDITPFLYLAGYTHEGTDVAIYRTSYSGGSFDSLATVYSAADMGNVRISALGQGPTVSHDLAGTDPDHYVAVCYSNSMDTAEDGAVDLLKYTPGTGDLASSGTTIAETNHECSSLQTNKQGDVIIGGTLQAYTIPGAEVQAILHTGALPELIKTDPQVYSLADATLYYADSFIIASSAFKPSLPQSQRVLERSRGAAFVSSSRGIRLAHANDRIAGGANAFVAEIKSGGSVPKLLGQIRPASDSNLNASTPFTSFHSGIDHHAPYWLPLGRLSSSKKRTTPSTTCRDRTKPFQCFAQKMGIDKPGDPTPTPTPEAPEPYCGDGEIDVESEVCDGEELGSQTCVSQGFSSGVLACGANCQFDTSNCVNIDPPEGEVVDGGGSGTPTPTPTPGGDGGGCPPKDPCNPA